MSGPQSYPSASSSPASSSEAADLSRVVAEEVAGRCACMKARRLARDVTRRYDAALAPAGITTPQFTALAAAAGARGAISLTALGRRLGMDRSTVSRTVKPLVARGLVAHDDTLPGRARGLRLTDAGASRLAEALPLWRTAQAAYAAALAGEWDALHDALDAAAQA